MPKALSPTIYPQATPCKAQSQDDWALPEGLGTNNIRRQCPARSSHKMTGPCRALPEGLVTNNNIRRQCPARPGDYKMTWALSGFAAIASPTISSAGHTLQGPVTKMTWACKGAAEHVIHQLSVAKICQDLPRFTTICPDLPRFAGFSPVASKLFRIQTVPRQPWSAETSSPPISMGISCGPSSYS